GVLAGDLVDDRGVAGSDGVGRTGQWEQENARRDQEEQTQKRSPQGVHALCARTSSATRSNSGPRSGTSVGRMKSSTSSAARMRRRSAAVSRSGWTAVEGTGTTVDKVGAPGEKWRQSYRQPIER